MCKVGSPAGSDVSRYDPLEDLILPQGAETTSILSVLECVERALHADPDDTVAWNCASVVLKSDPKKAVVVKNRRYDFLSVLTETVKLDPTSMNAWSTLFRILGQQLKDADTSNPKPGAFHELCVDPEFCNVLDPNAVPKEKLDCRRCFTEALSNDNARQWCCYTIGKALEVESEAAGFDVTATIGIKDTYHAVEPVQMTAMDCYCQSITLNRIKKDGVFVPNVPTYARLRETLPYFSKNPSYKWHAKGFHAKTSPVIDLKWIAETLLAKAGGGVQVDWGKLAAIEWPPEFESFMFGGKAYTRKDMFIRGCDMNTKYIGGWETIVEHMPNSYYPITIEGTTYANREEIMDGPLGGKKVSE